MTENAELEELVEETSEAAEEEGSLLEEILAEWEETGEVNYSKYTDE